MTSTPSSINLGNPEQAARPHIIRDFDWDDLRFFLAVAAAGSLSGAARELHVNTTTVLRRIGHLEDNLSIRLFDRSRNGYQLTAEGTRLLQALDPVDQKLSSLLRDFEASSEGLSGNVKLALPETLALHLLIPALPEFHAKHQNIGLELVFDTQLTDAKPVPRIINNLRDVDIAIRLARPTQGDMLIRKLGDLPYGLYASADYIKTHGGLVGDDLSGHHIIGFSEDDPPLGPVWWMSHATRHSEVVIRTSNALARAEAVRQGIGIAALPRHIAEKIDGLQCLADHKRIGQLEIWLLTRSDLAQFLHVRMVMDFVIAQLRL